MIYRALLDMQHKMGNRSVLTDSKDIPSGTKAYISAFTTITRTKLTPRYFGPYTVDFTTDNSVVFLAVKVNREHVKTLNLLDAAGGDSILLDYTPMGEDEAMEAGQSTGVSNFVKHLHDGVHDLGPSPRKFGKKHLNRRGIGSLKTKPGPQSIHCLEANTRA